MEIRYFFAIESDAMESVYVRIREKARNIASHFPQQAFYNDFSLENEFALKIFETDAVINQLRTFVYDRMDDDFGHGIKHSAKVALDAGALAFIESQSYGYSQKKTERLVVIAQSAGLLHDVKRKEKNHAAKGAIYSKEIIKSHPFTDSEKDAIAVAIHNHQAFKKTIAADSINSQLISDCLYDADKFRWGPDNFTDTVWDMVAFFHTPLAEFVSLYPKAMQSLTRIKKTFRTNTGKIYGPRFIDTGLAIGYELFKEVRKELSV